MTKDDRGGEHARAADGGYAGVVPQATTLPIDSQQSDADRRPLHREVCFERAPGDPPGIRPLAGLDLAIESPVPLNPRGWRYVSLADVNRAKPGRTTSAMAYRAGCHTSGEMVINADSVHANSAVSGGTAEETSLASTS